MPERVVWVRTGGNRDVPYLDEGESGESSSADSARWVSGDDGQLNDPGRFGGGVGADAD